MEIKINENIYFKTLNNKKELREFILNMILESKTDKIIYKGEPHDLSYKIMKKILLPKQIIKTSKNLYTPDEIRLQYLNILHDVKEQYCIIYKK